MKKITWIIALLAALALIFVGCPGEGDEEPPPQGGDGDGDAKNWFLATDDEGTKVPNNQLTLHGTDDADGRTYIRIFFDPPGDDFEKIKIDFTISDNGGNVCWQSVKDSTGTWGFDGTGLSDGNYIGWFENGPIDIDPATRFKSSWGATGAALQKSSMFFVCIYVTGTVDNAVFTLTGVSFTGIGKDPTPTEPPTTTPTDSPIQVYFNETAKSAVVKGSNSVSVSGNTITAAWNPADEGGAFRIKVDLNEGFNISSDYSKFVMEWTSGSAVGGNFNISLYFPGNRMLSAYAASGSAEFNFTTDHPSWAAGTTWGGASVGTITGFEIFSDDDTNIGSDNLVITKISFE